MSKILIIDRHPDINLYYKYAFEKIDVESTFLDNFESAQYLLSIERFDALIIDPVVLKYKERRLNYSEGLKLIERIKEHYKTMPVIINSAVDDLDEYFEQYHISVDSYVIKSLDESALVSEVIKSLGLEKEYKASSKKQAKIFISYARQDFSKAYAIYEVLRQMEYSPWIDNENILPGQDWESEIEKAIQNSNFFLALLSSNSISKEGYFQKELKKGMSILDEKPEGAIYLIPVRLDDCEVPKRFQRIQWCNAFEDHGLDRLLEAIELGCKERGISNK